MEMSKLVEDTIKRTSEELAKSLKRNNLIKSSDPTAFQKTETLLYNYNGFKNAIADKFKQMESIKAEGIEQRSKGITVLPSNPQLDTRSEMEKCEDKVEKLYAIIIKTNEYIELIDAALEKVSNDPYFEIIKLKYLEDMTREDIACELGVDVSTITRNKNRLVNTIKIFLFSDDVMLEMFGVS